VRIFATLEWISGRLTFARVDIANRTYGARTEQTEDSSEFVYTFRRASIDRDTNGLVYAPDAVVVAAASLGRDGTRLGVKSGVADAKELVLASRVIVTVALLGFADFRRGAECLPRGDTLL
jgi:hypothetical protein